MSWRAWSPWDWAAVLSADNPSVRVSRMTVRFMVVCLSFRSFEFFAAFAFTDTDADGGAVVIAKIVKEV